MTFTTYAQNGEDILLWRALGHLGDGFYIDVGANDPVEHSVTKAFYDAGWHGINVEPLPAFHASFASQRPRDINLGVAAGATDGEITLFDVPAVNGWASPDADVAAGHRAQGHQVCEVRVAQRTLSGICAEHVHGPVHFLKIDVEGFEGEVLRGMDLQRWRPWILVIEATIPNSRLTNHERWEALVTSQHYLFAYFDGLNRYYVAEEHAELLPVLALQPNVFDAAVPWQLARAETHLAQQAQALAHSTAQLAHECAAHADTRLRLAQATARHAAVEEALCAECAAHARTRATLGVDDEGHEAEREHLQAQLGSANSALAASTDELAQAGAYARKLEQDLASAAAWARDLEAELLTLRNSRYLRLTGALRQAGHGRMHRAPLLLARRALRRAVTWLASREALRRLILPRLARHPWLAARISRTITTIKQNPPSAPVHARVAAVAPYLAPLPASARRVFLDLGGDAGQE